MKRTSPVILLLSVFFLSIIACTKIDTTTLGSGLIPAVDNVSTFDLALNVNSDNLLLADSLRVIGSDPLPVGEIFDDPEFGRTVSNLYFTVYPNSSSKPFYPFYVHDSTTLDSVVLQLKFSGLYGDSNTTQTFRVEEIAQNSGFGDTAFTLGRSFPTAGILGTKTVNFTTLNDTNVIIRKDTTKLVNVLRIRLNNSFAQRLIDYDTTNTANGAYRSDSVFSTLLRGLAITVDSNKASNKALAYFTLSDTSSRLIVYSRIKRNGVIDTTTTSFFNTGVKNSLPVAGQASSINRTPQHGYATYLANPSPNEDRVYLQSSPGSYGLITIPGLDTMQNKLIYRAELVVPRVAAAGNNIFGVPDMLFLDLINPGKDSAYTVQNDFFVSTGGPNFSTFGGTLKSDQTYRFDVTRHVQGILTRHERNLQFRLYAPLVTLPWYVQPGAKFSTAGLARVSVPINTLVGAGRVVLYGGAEADATKKMRLYIVYSKI